MSKKNKSKKILFAAVTLDVGGIETSLVTLLNCLAELKENSCFKYDITLVLEKKQGVFLKDLNNRINVIVYKPCAIKNDFIRKSINFIKQSIFKLKYGSKYDFSVAYATYSKPASFVARAASINSALWCHMDYMEQYQGNEKKVKKFFQGVHYDQFKNIVFVSNEGKESFIKIYPDISERVKWINNMIDYQSIFDKSKESIDENDSSILSKIDRPIFIHLGRHDEDQKRVSRLIEAARILKKEKEKFSLILVGDGQDSKRYKKIVNEKNLNDTVIFLGRRSNPYPYLDKSDCLVLSSDYEGAPVVFIEAMILKKPIITTSVSGSSFIKDKYGVVVDKKQNEITETMREFIKNKYKYKNVFDYEKYNSEALKSIEKMING